MQFSAKNDAALLDSFSKRKREVGYATGASLKTIGASLRIASACYVSADVDLRHLIDIIIIFPTTSPTVLHCWRKCVFPCLKSGDEIARVLSALADMKYSALVFDSAAFKAQQTPYLFWL